jgi:hypothetical protein
LYVTSSYSQSNTTIAYKYDTKQAAGMNIAIPFTNPGNYNSQISYNHNDKKLYSWDSTRLQTYDVKF